jgi:GTP cyclohydrolase N terminal
MDEHHEITSDVVAESWPTKIVLHTYPKQVGVNPAPMDWGNLDPQLRGPVVVSRHKATVRRRNGM